MKVGIVGGGKAGTVFLKSLLELENVTVVGICDINSDAPGLVLARQHGIPVCTDLESFFSNEMDVLLELTGNQSVREKIKGMMHKKTHLVDSDAAKLVAMLSEHQQSLNARLQNYIDHMQTLLKHLAGNISEINDTVKSIDSTSKKMAESVSNSMESIKRTDQIIKIINDITTRIKILGINASIEAARAGDYGRGFSVVAEEIGKLTASSKNATSEITDIIEKMKTDISSLSQITDTLGDICKKQTEVAGSLNQDNIRMAELLN
ncbi:hypothetical protein D2962_16365 [Biomaibacter acetigenes]|uniref:Methyl-accepting transducer domain-containing protein n=1 Tax=Biomaibacter acetigenes TaxID=2316383 RepID=A0A3G2RAA8_9FIRM|nr:methyl-accepting chemotaxis protein [Biomaibacter acetigenes]AYO31958.1 hypothetical protein D2962_16365 [Biomaibacter acetigenes]